jgi:NAD(P)-dependent dehydrogenase (short-subunit alcohol dehydrogenase family)
VDELADQLGGVGVLVNNGGTGHSTKALDLDYEKWRSVVATDLDGPFLCAQRAARRMIEQGDGGRIVNVTSVHEHVPRLGASAYCSAKAGLGMLTKVLALELAEHGIRVNAIAPGGVATPGTGFREGDPAPDEVAAAAEQSIARIPMGRLGDPDEIGRVAVFLATELSSYMTGAQIVVDGGMLLR